MNNPKWSEANEHGITTPVGDHLERVVRLNNEQRGYLSGFHDSCASVAGVVRRTTSPMRTPAGWHRCVICGGFDRGVESSIRPADYFEPVEPNVRMSHGEGET